MNEKQIFKIGDRVRATKSNREFWSEGDLGTIQELTLNLGGLVWIKFDKNNDWKVLKPGQFELLEDELDLSKPCKIKISEDWRPVVGKITLNKVDGVLLYGCYYRSFSNNELFHIWAVKPYIRNIRSLQYEPHTRESLLPFAGEWVHHIDDSNNCFPFNRIANDEVEVDRMVLPYKRLADKYVWATGPDKGKPVAKLLPSNEA